MIFGANLAEREEIICSTGGSASLCYPIVSEMDSGGLIRRTQTVGAASAVPPVQLGGVRGCTNTSTDLVCKAKDSVVKDSTLCPNL